MIISLANCGQSVLILQCCAYGIGKQDSRNDSELMGKVHFCLSQTPKHNQAMPVMEQVENTTARIT